MDSLIIFYLCCIFSIAGMLAILIYLSIKRENKITAVVEQINHRFANIKTHDDLKSLIEFVIDNKKELGNSIYARDIVILSNMLHNFNYFVENDIVKFNKET